MDPSKNPHRDSQQSTRTTTSVKSNSSADTLGQVYTDYSTRNQPLPPQRQTATFGTPGGPGTSSRPSSRGKTSQQGTPPVSRHPSLASLPGTQPPQDTQSLKSSRTSGSSSLYTVSSIKSNPEGGLRDPAQARKNADAAKAIQEEAERRRAEAERLERQAAFQEYEKKHLKNDEPFKANLEQSSSSQKARIQDRGKRRKPEDQGKK